MDKILYYYTVVLLVINGLLLCNGANDVSMNNVVMVDAIQSYPQNNNRAHLNRHDTAGSHLMDSVEAKVLIPSSQTPAPASTAPPVTATISAMLPPAIAIVSTMLPPATATVPPIPSAATATMKPGGNDMSKIINLLFVIMLVVTAILMAITGFCMMGLRRRYLIVSEQPRYEQLKPIPI